MADDRQPQEPVDEGVGAPSARTERGIASRAAREAQGRNAVQRSLDRRGQGGS